jgi:hypothetical protein
VYAHEIEMEREGIRMIPSGREELLYRPKESAESKPRGVVLEGQAEIWTSFAIAMLSHFAVGPARSVFTGRGVVSNCVRGKE